VPDAMLELKQIQITARNIQTLLSSVHLGNNQTIDLLASMTQELHQLLYNIGIDEEIEDVNVWIAFSRILQTSA
jgi:hypothetical protein